MRRPHSCICCELLQSTDSVPQNPPLSAGAVASVPLSSWLQLVDAVAASKKEPCATWNVGFPTSFATSFAIALASLAFGC